MKPVSVGRLKNGLIFYSHYDQVAHVSGIGVKAGSIQDPHRKRGMAHLLEHVITSRTKELSDFEVDLLFWKYMGGPDKDRKIQTDRFATFYGHGTLHRKHFMLQCFPVFASMVRHSILDPNDVLSEKGAVREEYFMRGIDWLPVLVDDLMHESMYEKNPARNRIDCEPEELKSITIDEMKGFLRKYYVPNNMFVIVLGPSHEDAKRMAQKYFGDMTPRQISKLDYDFSEDMPLLSAPKIVEVSRPGIHQHHFALGFPTEKYISKDAETIDILAQILDFRLYRRIRSENRDPEKGVYRVEVETSRSFVHGLIYIYFASSSGEFVEESKTAVIEELEKLKQEKVLPEELDAMKTRLEAEYGEAFSGSPEDLADLIIAASCNGDEELERLHSFKANLRRVTRKKILDAANKYFIGNYVQILVVPA